MFVNADQSSCRKRRLALVLGFVSFLSIPGCGSGEREIPIVGGSSGKVEEVTAGVDFPAGKPAPRKSTGKRGKQAVPIDIPAGPGNK
jgi:hypothetical protein